MAADSGMETCTSPEITDSRKRPLDGDIENGGKKRSHYGGGGDGVVYHLKVLVPCVAAGAIIGKGGETIAQLQKDTGARMKMSKANDFYPCTTERVCLVTGSVEAIMSVMSFIMDKIKEKPDLTPKPNTVSDLEFKLSADRSKQVKILIPNSTAGMIIGKGGNYIKQIKEESGSYIQLSQKSNDASLQLQERCVTIVGELENNKKAIAKLLAKVVEDPQSGSCLNVSYADISGPVANFNPTGSPYANSTSPDYCSTTSLTSAVAPMLVNGAGLTFFLNFTSPTTSSNHTLTTQLIESVKVALRGSGYSEQATTEIITAMTTLDRFGILRMVLGLTPASTTHTALFTSQYLVDSTPTVNGTAGGMFGAIGTVGTAPAPRATERFGDTFDPFRPQPGTTSPITINNNSFGLGSALSPHAPTLSPSHPDKESKKIEIEINEVIVGAILGPGGRALIEIQHMSGAAIQISKKGTFAPGTRNRIVTITGSQSAITTAHHLIQQKINEEEAKRARQSALSILQ
ncbi:hypothetical protein RUM44_001474 [Polyplax serrata]